MIEGVDTKDSGCVVMNLDDLVANVAVLSPGLVQVHRLHLRIRLL